MNRDNLFIAGNVLLLPLSVFLIINFADLKSHYDQLRKNDVILQEQAGVPFKVIKAKMKREGPLALAPAVMAIGDVLGTNVLSANKLFAKEFSLNTPQTQIIIPHLKKTLHHLNSQEDYYNMIATENGVVLADNFCIEGWEDIREKEVYKKTSLTPGPFCFSEPQTMLVNQLINQFQVKEVYVYYDIPGYLEKIETFLTYLEESGVSYKLIDATKE